MPGIYVRGTLKSCSQPLRRHFYKHLWESADRASVNGTSMVNREPWAWLRNDVIPPPPGALQVAIHFRTKRNPSRLHRERLSMTTSVSRRIQTVIVLLACLLSLATFASARTVFTDSFSGGGLFSRYKVRGGCKECFSKSGGSLKVTNKGGKEKRAELLPKRKSTSTAYNKEIEWQFDVKFTQADKRKFIIFWQTNTRPFKGPDMMLTVQNGKIRAYLRNKGARKSYVRKNIGTAKVGKWMDFKVRFRRHLKKGYFQVVLNGRTVWTYNRGPTTQSSHSDSRTKFGLYSGGSSRGTWEALFDNLRIIRR